MVVVVVVVLIVVFIVVIVVGDVYVAVACGSVISFFNKYVVQGIRSGSVILFVSFTSPLSILSYLNKTWR